MVRLGSWLLGAALLASVTSSCLLYTDHINHPPEVTISGDTTVPWGAEQGARYHAQARDPDQSADTLVYEWRRQPGACRGLSSLLATASTSPILGDEADFEVDVDLPDEFCVWVRVIDADKASAIAWRSTRVTHKDLQAVIDIVKPKTLSGDHVPLYSTVQLSGARSMDPERTGDLTFSWVVGHNRSLTGPPPCPQGPMGDVCFTVDQPGEYQVDLTVKNSRGQEAKVQRTFFVEEDAPPCIRMTQPVSGLERTVVDAGEMLTFKVTSVEDDGDPYPALLGSPPTAKFKVTWWFEGEDPSNPSGRRPADNAMDPEIVFGPTSFHAGDQVSVRIQVDDRVSRDFSRCVRDKVANCALGKDQTCFQWVTWKLDVRLGRDR